MSKLSDEIYQKINEYETIIILRHKSPDLDALGSQFGLAKSIQKTYPNKRVYCVGDITKKYRFMGEFDTIEDSLYSDALVIVLDTGSLALVSDVRHEMANYLIKIDHHINREPYGDICFVKEDYSSTCEIVTEFIREMQMVVDLEVAKDLYHGMVTDSGRFLYNSTTHKTLELASYLLKYGIDIDSVHQNIYLQEEETVRLRGYFMQNFVRDGHVAYLKHSYESINEFDFDFFTMSRGMVSVMSNINGIDIWANFTEKSVGEIICELRAKALPVVEVATKYGGGGHKLACGCTLSNWDEVDNLIQDLKNL